MQHNPLKHTLKVFLYEISPQIWRRLNVSGDLTFSELHHILQLSMGWENKQQHEFRYGTGKKLKNVIAAEGEDVDVEGKFHDEELLTINELLGRKKLPFRMLYRYDFLEDWIHELVFEQKKEGQKGEEIFTSLIEGERACPPEDCGGAWGYMSALEGEVDWMDNDYDPEFFDTTKIIFND